MEGPLVFADVKAETVSGPPDDNWSRMASRRQIQSLLCRKYLCASACSRYIVLCPPPPFRKRRDKEQMFYPSWQQVSFYWVCRPFNKTKGLFCSSTIYALFNGTRMGCGGSTHWTRFQVPTDRNWALSCWFTLHGENQMPFKTLFSK